ncbi:MAG: PEP-CTERM sorting domain-containing protein [Pseudomonadota bacterium]
MFSSRKIALYFGALAGVALSPTSASAALIFDGVEFPQGEISFADAVGPYSTGSSAPSAPYQGTSNALGVPDYVAINSCASQADCTFLSLGDGGSIVLEFTDNFLTGSGTPSADLWIFEIGPDVEDTFVDISRDGVNWLPVGAVGGSTSGVDIDAAGFGINDRFSFVRLTDDTTEGQQSGATVGADIDAVGAISTVSAAVPEPSTWMIMLLGFFGVGAALRHAGRQSQRIEWATGIA